MGCVGGTVIRANGAPADARVEVRQELAHGTAQRGRPPFQCRGLHGKRRMGIGSVQINSVLTCVFAMNQDPSLKRRGELASQIGDLPEDGA